MESSKPRSTPSPSHEQKPAIRRRKFQAKPIASHTLTLASAAGLPAEHLQFPRSPQRPASVGIQGLAEGASTEVSLQSPPFSPVSVAEDRIISIVGSPIHAAGAHFLSSPGSFALGPVAKQKRISSVGRGGKLDSTRHTLADLVDWQPHGENSLQKRWMQKREQLERDSTTSVQGEAEEWHGMPKASVRRTGNSTARVVMNEDGEMVLEEVEEEESHLEDVWETADDALATRKINSMSFRVFKRASTWTPLETDLFYEVLAATGTDFSLMHDYIPIRSRAELKRKFTREEKENPDRINEVTHHPCLLDDKVLQNRANHFLRRINREKEEKVAKRRKTGKKRAEPETGDGESHEQVGTSNDL